MHFSSQNCCRDCKFKEENWVGGLGVCLDTKADFSPAITKDGTCNYTSRSSDRSRIIAVKVIFLFDFLVFGEGAVAAWNKEFHKGTKKPP